MSEPARALMNALFPALLLVFLGLYLAGLVAGVEPEFAMLRAGLGSLVLAAVGRFATGMLENLLPAVAIDEVDTESALAASEGPDSADPRPLTPDPLLFTSAKE